MTGAPNSGNRQWPDIMMWILVLALLLGFFLMLVTGKRDAGVRPVPTTTTTGETTVIPSSPGVIESDNTTSATSEPPPAPAASQGLTQEELETGTSNTSSAADTSNNSSTSIETTNNTTTNSSQTSSIPPAPEAPTVTPIEPPVLPENLTETDGSSSNFESSAAPTPASTTGKESAPARPQVTTIPPTRTGGAVPVSQNRTPLRSDFRIMLGTFSSNRTLRGSTSAVSGLGYTVHSIDVGDQLVAQVGPFANEEAARRALQDIHRAYSGALLYRPKSYQEKVVKPEGRSTRPPPAAITTSASNNQAGQGLQQAVTTSAQSAPKTTVRASSQNTPPPIATPAANTPEPIAQKPAQSVSRPATTEAMYLQVGAFEQEESAQRMVSKLRDTGFAPVVNAPEGSKVTVVVGPYGGQDLAQAESRLDAAGIAFFRFR